MEDNKLGMLFIVTILGVLIVLIGIYSIALPSRLKHKSETYLKLMYNYSSIKELQDNNEVLVKMTHPRLIEYVDVNSPVVLLNRYMPYKDEGVKVSILTSRSKGFTIWVVFELDNAIRGKEQMMAVLKFKRGKVFEFQDYLMKDVLTKHKLTLPDNIEQLD